MTAVREACHNILYIGVNSAAMNGVDENTRIVSVLPLWQTWLIAFDLRGGRPDSWWAWCASSAAAARIPPLRPASSNFFPFPPPPPRPTARGRFFKMVLGCRRLSVPSCLPGRGGGENRAEPQLQTAAAIV